jgi:hypothetical protein
MIFKNVADFVVQCIYVSVTFIVARTICVIDCSNEYHLVNDMYDI